jgi:alpha-ribazole phosphatase
MTRLWWVRHGPTHAKEMIGWTDRPADLSDLAAVGRLRAHLPQAPVLSSDLVRAVATAQALGGARCLPPLPALREIHFGEWEGLRFDQAEARDPTLIRRFWEEPGQVAAPGGESWGELAARVNGAVDGVIAGHAGDVVVVAHFGVILTQVERALGIPTTQAFAQKIEPLSVTCIEVAGRDWRLRSVNHLP